MVSKWFKLKSRAIALRKKGLSIRAVEINLGIPRSTLSGWFKNVGLTQKQKDKLRKDWLNGLNSARAKAVRWHNGQKEERMKIAEAEATKIADKINYNDTNTLELALAMLYLGEGFKKSSTTGIGNSDPMILRFFVTILKNTYNVRMEHLYCYLHLRADQDPNSLTKYWSEQLNIPVQNFGKASIDKRTVGSKTYDSYKGVCVVRCKSVAIQRKLVYLSRIYCEKIIENLGG
jgi:hypothetical protein